MQCLKQDNSLPRVRPKPQLRGQSLATLLRPRDLPATRLCGLNDYENVYNRIIEAIKDLSHYYFNFNPEISIEQFPHLKAYILKLYYIQRMCLDENPRALELWNATAYGRKLKGCESKREFQLIDAELDILKGFSVAQHLKNSLAHKRKQPKYRDVIKD